MRVAEYKKINGKMSLVYRDVAEQEIIDKLNQREEVDIKEITQIDRIEAQVLYTALITDTLIEEV